MHLFELPTKAVVDRNRQSAGIVRVQLSIAYAFTVCGNLGKSSVVLSVSEYSMRFGNSLITREGFAITIQSISRKWFRGGSYSNINAMQVKPENRNVLQDVEALWEV